ncbi:zinc finger protein 84-like [Cottoperca gobio]|uniref:Zinc finger protein 84-like n=1 Tax=Cottoperca gobio TaxID=56716 RepID=A0A6J2RPP0_COTGO|nr:zinc finger protein 84-like [Cottoperca gobio]XP_029311427.1 zinc finger protein 84-like [Cottoperca gobio]
MSQTLTRLDSHFGHHLSMLKTGRMELLRALVSERLSAAADEIFKIVERTIVEYEKKMTCSKWVVDSHHRLLDVAMSHSEDSLHMSDTVRLQSGQQQPAASVNVSVCWEEPGNATSERPNMNNTHSDCSPASEKDHRDQEMLINIEDNDVKQECDLNMPLKILKVKKPFKCPVCMSTFSSKKTMVRHIKKHPEDNLSLYQCQFCDRYFCHKSEFIIHTRTHTGTKPYKCQGCEKSFDERDSLLVHRQQHTEEKPYWCLSEKVVAETHLRSAAIKIKELGCRQEDCGIKTFPLTFTPYDKSEFDQESLQPLCLYQIQTVADIDKDSSAAVTGDHMKAEPAGDDGVSDSTTDDQLLLSVNPSEQGEDETEPKRLNMKNILPRRPSGKSTELIVQFEAGTTQKPYRCPCCAKCFSLNKTLIRHVRIHTEDKQYQCQFCGRNFCQKSDLVNHTRIHTGERPYHCQECYKSFAQKGNLVVHMRKHAGDKPYQCQECSCSFNQRSSLDCHMQNHRLCEEFTALS